jgi:tetratricopeptide (TPR) repeat protein
MLARAGERARSLGAPDEGQRYFDQAAALADEPVDQAQLLEQSGRLALEVNRSAEARERLESAIALFEQAGHASSAARASVALADVDATEARLDEAASRLEHAVAALQDGKPDAALAGALAQLGRMRALAGHTDASVAPLERALELAERLQLPDVFVEALNSKSIVLGRLGRNAEAKVLLEAAVARAHEEQLYGSAIRAQNNLAVLHQSADRHAEALEVIERSLALARRRGDRRWESNLRTGEIEILFMLGRWDEALAVAADEEPFAQSMSARASLATAALVHTERGDPHAARAILRANEVVRDGDLIQNRASYHAVDARVLRAEGRPGEALAAAERVLDLRPDMAVDDLQFKTALIEGIEAALELTDVEKADELLSLLESLDPGELTPFLQANAVRLRARLEAARGTDGMGERLLSAAALFREFGMVFSLAVTLLEHAELTGDEESLAEAREIFERLEAAPWLERASAAQPVTA